VHPPSPMAPFFELLVARIEKGGDDAVHEFRLHFQRGVKYLMARQLGPDRANELAQDVLSDVIEAIRNGEICEPERLDGYVRAVVQRMIAFEVNAFRRLAGPSPVRKDDLASAYRVLRSLPSRDREILVRFYSQEQPEEQICRELALTAAQFRVIKNRAKDQFAGHRRTFDR